MTNQPHPPLLQLPETPSTADWRAAAIAIQADTRESAIRISNGKSQVLRLRRHALPAVAQPFKLRPGDEYLITGGTGAVGWHFARWLVSHGATRLVLTGRTAAGEPHWAELRAGGVDIQIVAADASDLAAMQTLIARLSRLRGVIHAAGIGGFDTIANMTESSLRDVLRPKVEGGWNLHLATQGLPLDFFVVCSSIASSSADCTFAGARLISSASTMFANSGPSRVSNSPLRGL